MSRPSDLCGCRTPGCPGCRHGQWHARRPGTRCGLSTCGLGPMAKHPASTGVVHIAGLVIDVPPRMRQRCAWCGATLIDYDLTRIAVPVGEDCRPGSWPVGELVRVDGAVSWVVEHSDGDKLPEDACARLDPAVTA